MDKPELDVMNRQVIEEFHALGREGRQPVRDHCADLLHDIGARTGTRRVNSMTYLGAHRVSCGCDHWPHDSYVARWPTPRRELRCIPSSRSRWTRSAPSSGYFETATGSAIKPVVAWVALKEPPKRDVLAWTPDGPMTRRALAVSVDRATGITYESVVNLSEGAVEQAEAKPGLHAPILAVEWLEATRGRPRRFARPGGPARARHHRSRHRRRRAVAGRLLR